MRAALQILLLIVGIGAIALIAKGLTPVFPALGAVLRGLLHPVAIALILGLFLLIRMGRPPKRSGSNRENHGD